ncbi:MAG: RyR domain-containing protein [Hyphomicrobiaceae bacterium]
MGRYVPKPIDTTAVVLPLHLEELTELLAENAHENWAAQRIEDGWRWGAHRSDVDKSHPSLVAYEQLPEAEKAYDRRTAMETVKAIVSLGYEISHKTK